MKKITCLLLCLSLVLGLAGCSAHDRAVYSYEHGKYEKAAQRFEELGDTDYVNKCRFMLLYEYILEKGELTTDATYTVYTSCVSDLAYIGLYADPEVEGQIQVSFSMSEEVESYDVTLELNVDDTQSTYQIIQTAEADDGTVTMTTCDGTVDTAQYLTASELEYEQCQRTVMSATASTSSENVGRASRKTLFAYFSLAVDGLYELLTDLDMGTDMKNLGFALWEYV